MADFGVAKRGETFFLAAYSDAAKELCDKYLPSGEIQTGKDGVLIFPLEKNDLMCKLGTGILGFGLTMVDMNPPKDD